MRQNIFLILIIIAIGILFSQNSFAQGPANKTLSNLTSPTAVNVDLLPNATNAISLGSSTLRWKDVNLFNLKFSDGTTQTTAAVVGANLSLSNLSATAVNQSLLPGTTSAFDLGSSSLGWKDIYAAGSIFLDGTRFIDNSGTSNTWIGNTGNTTNSGTGNAAVGTSALMSNTSGYNNTAVGGFASFSNTTGFQNTAAGRSALYYNTTGYSNTGIGDEALYSNSSGHNLTAVGYGALALNSTASDNTACGNNALHLNGTGTLNSAFGSYALYYNSTGFYNTASGYGALYSNDGNNNTASGVDALYYNTSGSQNTAYGLGALFNNTTGTYMTAVGYFADANSGGYTNSSAFGYSSYITGDNQVRVGNGYVTSIGGFANWTNISDGRFKKNIKENVSGLEFINKLQPVTYTLDIHGINTFLRKDMKQAKDANGNVIQRQPDDEDGIVAKEKIVYSGFIAQDVERVAEETGYDFSGVDAPKNENDLYGLRYAEFVVPLVKAVQELSKQNDELKHEVEELKSSIVKRESSMSDGYVRAQVSPFGGDLEGAILGQNIPNPFGNSTLIPFRIPCLSGRQARDCNNASIMITNTSTSEVISVIPISCNENHVSIEAGTLASGMYSYTLYVDGKMIDTKQMELIK